MYHSKLPIAHRLRSESCARVVFIADGKSKNRNYGLIQELVTLRYLESRTFLADIPVGIQKVLMYTIAPLGMLFGYRALNKKYSGIEK